jgi:hypothetical protein
MTHLNDVLRPASGVVSRKSGGDMVVVLPEQARFLVLNDTGAQIWQLADGQRNLAQIAEALVDSWQIEQAQAEADVLRLSQQLLERGALVREEV